jgi:hypothetical protein
MKCEEGEATHLFGVSLFSSVKLYARGWSLLSSTEGKDYRRVEMTVVVLLHRTDLSYSVETRPRRIRIQGLPKPLEELLLLLLAEHHLASGQTLKLKDEFGFLTPELLIYLVGHPLLGCVRACR